MKDVAEIFRRFAGLRQDSSGPKTNGMPFQWTDKNGSVRQDPFRWQTFAVRPTLKQRLGSGVMAVADGLSLVSDLHCMAEARGSAGRPTGRTRAASSRALDVGGWAMWRVGA